MASVNGPTGLNKCFRKWGWGMGEVIFPRYSVGRERSTAGDLLVEELIGTVSTDDV